MNPHRQAIEFYLQAVGMRHGGISVLTDVANDEYGAKRCIDCTGLKLGACQRPGKAGFTQTSMPFELGSTKTMHQNCGAYQQRRSSGGK